MYQKSKGKCIKGKCITAIKMCTLHYILVVLFLETTTKRIQYKLGKQHLRKYFKIRFSELGNFGSIKCGWVHGSPWCSPH